MAKIKLLTRISSAALAALTALTFASCGSKKTAMETVEAAADKSYTQLTEKSDLVNKLEKVANDGSIELKMDVGTLLQAFAPVSGLDLTASIKGYSDADGGRSALRADILSGGTSIADLLLYMADNSISVSSNALFGNDVYGFSTDNFLSAFNNSQFGEDGYFSLGISAEDISAAIDSVDNYAVRAEKVTALEETVNDVWDGLKDDVYALIEDNGTNTTSDATLSVGGKDVKTTDVNFTYTGDQIADIIKGALELAKDNDDVKEILDAMLEMMKSYYPSEEMYDLPAVDELMDTLNGALDEGLDSIDDIREDLADFKFSFTMHIGKSSQELIGLTVDISENANSVVMKAVFGPSVNDIDEISFSVDYKDEYESHEMWIKYIVTEDTNDTYRAELSYNMDGDKADLAEIEWNKKSGELDASVTFEGETVSIKGKLLNEKDSITLAVNSVTAQGVTVDVGEIALILSTNDTMPTNGAYTDILAMDEYAISDLLNEISESAQDIVSVLGMY